MEPTAVTTNQATWPTLSRKRPGPVATPLAPPYARGNRLRSTCMVDMSVPRPESDADRGQHHVDREEGHDAQHQRLVDGGADTFGAAGDRQAAVAADQAGDQPEGQRLDDGDDHLGQAGD